MIKFKKLMNIFFYKLLIYSKNSIENEGVIILSKDLA